MKRRHERVKKYKEVTEREKKKWNFLFLTFSLDDEKSEKWREMHPEEKMTMTIADISVCPTFSNYIRTFLNTPTVYGCSVT